MLIIMKFKISTGLPLEKACWIPRRYLQSISQPPQADRPSTPPPSSPEALQESRDDADISRLENLFGTINDQWPSTNASNAPAPGKDLPLYSTFCVRMTETRPIRSMAVR